MLQIQETLPCMPFTLPNISVHQPHFALDINNLLNNKETQLTNPISQISSTSSSDSTDDEKEEGFKNQKSKEKFTEVEDMKLKQLVSFLGTKNWKFISKEMGTKNARQCRERWRNYLNPELNLGSYTVQEDMLIVNLFNKLGPKWKKISNYLPGRSPNSIRNRMKHLKNYPLRVQIENLKRMSFAKV